VISCSRGAELSGTQGSMSLNTINQVVQTEQSSEVRLPVLVDIVENKNKQKKKDLQLLLLLLFLPNPHRVLLRHEENKQTNKKKKRKTEQNQNSAVTRGRPAVGVWPFKFSRPLTSSSK